MRLSVGFGVTLAAGFALCGAAFAQSEPAINQAVAEQLRDEFLSNLNPEPLATPRPGSNEPRIHQAIMAGDLRAFNRSLGDAGAEGFQPRTILPATRVLTPEVQNAVSQNVRVHMLRELVARQGQAGMEFQSHLFAYGPPELVSEYMRIELDDAFASGGPAAPRTMFLSSYFPMVTELTTSRSTSRNYFSWDSVLWCNYLGMAGIGAATAQPGTFAEYESLSNLITAIEISPVNLLIEDKACTLDNSRLPSLVSADMTLLDVLVFFGAGYGNPDAVETSLNILSRAGLISQSDVDASASKFSAALDDLYRLRGNASARASLGARLASEPISRGETALHRALLQGDLAGARANLNQSDSPGTDPAGILPYYRVYTPRVQNQLTASQQSLLAHQILENTSVTLDRRLVLPHLAAYGSLDDFRTWLGQTSLFDANQGRVNTVRAQFNLSTMELGQEEFPEFGPTRDTCPLLMHVYYSYMSAPENSVQLEEARKKIRYLLAGTHVVTEGVRRDSRTLADPEDTCTFHQVTPNPLSPGGVDIYVSGRPNLYSELGEHLNIATKRERALWVVNLLRELDRFQDGAIERWTQNVENRRREWAQRAADRRAAERRAEQQRRNQQQDQDWGAALAQGLALFSQGMQTQSGYGYSGSVSGYSSAGAAGSRTINSYTPRPAGNNCTYSCSGLSDAACNAEIAAYEVCMEGVRQVFEDMYVEENGELPRAGSTPGNAIQN